MQQLMQLNWNTADTTDGHAIIKSILLCLWAFVGVESAAVSTGMVKNPKRTVPLATMLGTGLAGIVGGFWKSYNDIPSLVGYMSMALIVYKLGYQLD